MKLAVGKFFDYRPASQWAFDVQFSDALLISRKTYSYMPTEAFSEEDLARLSQSVVSVTQPKYDITPDTVCYGNFDFVVPIYDANNCRLTITFEDTDDCLISGKLLSVLSGNVLGKSVPAWLNVHTGMFIKIQRYNTYDMDKTFMPAMLNTNSISLGENSSDNGVTYFCKMIEYTEPNYSRTSNTPTAATLSITFLVMPFNNYSMVDDSTVSYTLASELSLDKTLDDIITELKGIKMHIQATASVIGSRFGFGESGGRYGINDSATVLPQPTYVLPEGNKTSGISATYGAGQGYNDFEVSDALRVVYHRASWRVEVYDKTGRVVAQGFAADSGKGRNGGKGLAESEHEGRTPTGRYIVANNSTYRTGIKGDANANEWSMRMYAVGDTANKLEQYGRSSFNLHFGSYANFNSASNGSMGSQGCVTMADTRVFKFISQSIEKEFNQTHTRDFAQGNQGFYLDVVDD